MNVCAIAGRLVRDAVVKGADKKVLLFTVAAKSGYDEGEKKDRVNYVPCAVFNPSPELEKALVNGGKGTFVELEGRVQSNSYETKGERKFATEVVVFNRSIAVMKS